MEHIFDNRHTLQSFVVHGGYKESVSTPSNKYLISFEETKQFFLKNLSDPEFYKIKEYMHLEIKQEVNRKKIILWCIETMENALTNHRSYDFIGTGRITLRELFMERIAVNGCAYAIIFLKRHFYQKNKYPVL